MGGVSLPQWVRAAPRVKSVFKHSAGMCRTTQTPPAASPAATLDVPVLAGALGSGPQRCFEISDFATKATDCNITYIWREKHIFR